MRFKNICLATLFSLSVLANPNFTASAKVKLPSFFSNGMVLQQQTEANLWGWAKAASVVKVTTSWNKKAYSVIANANGQWRLKVNTPAAGGPYTVSISDGDPLLITDVMIGEVWLCSGQSNMEMPM